MTGPKAPGRDGAPPPPRIGQQREYLLRRGRLPLAFTQEDFLVMNVSTINSFCRAHERLSPGSGVLLITVELQTLLPEY